MNFEKVVEYFAQKLDESKRAEFIEKASKVESAEEAEALGKEFGIVLTKEERETVFKMAEEMELSAEMLRSVAGGHAMTNPWFSGPMEI